MLGIVLGERMLDRIVSPSFHVSRICGPKIGRSFHTTASQTLHTFPWCLSVGRFRSSRTKSVSFCWAGESCVVVAATATTDFQIRQRCDSSSEAFWVFMRVFDLVVEVEGVHGDCLCFGMILGLVAGVGM
jgi:hypothetical protein